MTHYYILEKFHNIFGIHVRDWFPNGKNSIRVKTSRSKEWIFIYYSAKNWLLETKESYADRLLESLKKEMDEEEKKIDKFVDEHFEELEHIRAIEKRALNKMFDNYDSGSEADVEEEPDDEGDQ